MAADFVIQHPCNPKAALGGGDQLIGAEKLLERIKAGHRAAAIRSIKEKAGERPEGTTVTVRLWNVNGHTEDREITYEELVALRGELDPHEADCADCPANCRGEPFSCVFVLNYPIRRTSETWLMDRLQPGTTVGGQFCLRALRDFNYTGEPIQRMRAGGLFASSRPITRYLEGDPFPKTAITSDQFFQAILGIGEPLNPTHCLLVLFWLGAVRVNGTIPIEPEEATPVLGIENAPDRAAQTSLDVGEPGEDTTVRVMQDLLRVLYTSWLVDAPLLVDA
jgi:hypothetical protein